MSDVAKVERKRGLGRGFDSLIPTSIAADEFDITPKLVDDGGAPVSHETMREIQLSLIDANPHQPRKNFDTGALEALAASIRVHGVLQPVVVSQVGSRFELIAGERRVRAARLAELQSVPAIVRSFDEQQKLELALIENLQREELNLLEVATAYRKLLDEFGVSAEDLSRRVGKDRSSISNTMRLLNLPIDAKHALVDGKISEGHARVLLTTDLETEKQAELLELILRNEWSVRQTEEYARAFRGRTGSKEKAQERISKVNQLTMDLGDYLGAEVSQHTLANGGKLIIRYRSEEELARIYKAIRQAG